MARLLFGQAGSDPSVWRPPIHRIAAVWQAVAGPLIALALMGPVLFVVLLAVTGR
jgi:hypothetical protein